MRKTRIAKTTLWSASMAGTAPAPTLFYCSSNRPHMCSSPVWPVWYRIHQKHSLSFHHGWFQPYFQYWLKHLSLSGRLCSYTTRTPPLYYCIIIPIPSTAHWQMTFSKVILYFLPSNLFSSALTGKWCHISNQVEPFFSTLQAHLNKHQPFSLSSSLPLCHKQIKIVAHALIRKRPTILI